MLVEVVTCLWRGMASAYAAQEGVAAAVLQCVAYLWPPQALDHMQRLTVRDEALGSQMPRQLLQCPAGRTVLQRSSTINKLSIVQYLHDELYIAKVYTMQSRLAHHSHLLT